MLKVIQSRAETPKMTDTCQTSNEFQNNVKHVCQLAEQACTEGDKPDIVLLHEFPFTGWFSGDRESKLKLSIEIPGPETERMGEIAKKHDTYMIFGSYAKEKDWPGHVLSIVTVIDRKGNIIKKVWKPRNIKRYFMDAEIYTTTVESVQKRFRDLYGIDEELPVIRTEFGNLAVSTAQMAPFVFSAYAMKGAEIFLRLATLFSESDVIHTAQCNRVYSAMANIPYDPPLGTASMIVSPRGKILAKIENCNDEGVISARIPIGEFRKNRTLPHFAKELTQPILNQYCEEIPLNHLDLPDQELPKDGREMKQLFDKCSKWRN